MFTEKELFEQRLAFINPDPKDKELVEKNKAEMEQLKKDYTFHAVKFSDDMDRWFDLWRKPKA